MRAQTSSSEQHFARLQVYIAATPTRFHSYMPAKKKTKFTVTILAVSHLCIETNHVRHFMV